MKQFKNNVNKNFIEGYYMNDLSICDKLIDFFEQSDNKKIGKLGPGIEDRLRKDSTDLGLGLEDVPKHPILHAYMKHLGDCLELYKKKYKFCDEGIGFWRLEDGYNIQRYKPSQGYHAWHCEKSSLKTSPRHLVWMTYLNNVEKGGETEWHYQNLKVKPEKGLTVIWPTDWTHTHRGHTTINENKYIITGWYRLINEDVTNQND